MLAECIDGAATARQDQKAPDNTASSAKGSVILLSVKEGSMLCNRGITILSMLKEEENQNKRKRSTHVFRQVSHALPKFPNVLYFSPGDLWLLHQHCGIAKIRGHYVYKC